MNGQWGLFVSLVVIGLCSSVTAAEEQNCDSVKCDYAKHYVELGCKPIIKPGECCAERFDCDNVINSDKTMCHFKGRSYVQGTQLPMNETGCRANCYCYEGDFRCAHIHCPSQVVYNRPSSDCVNIYSFDQCCSTDTVCEKEEVEKLPICVMDGKTYRKGEKMYPDGDLCYKCICDENFDNSTAIEKSPSCKLIDCGIEMTFYNAARDGCVPLYFGTSKCCPIGSKCPKSEDKKIPSESRKVEPNSADNTCKFGELSLQIGDKVTDSDKCTQCECVLPPMITCIKTNCEKIEV